MPADAVGMLASASWLPLYLELLRILTEIIHRCTILVYTLSEVLPPWYPGRCSRWTDAVFITEGLA